MGIIHDGKQWVGRKSDAWAQYLDISSRTVTRIVKYMVELGMISVEKLSSHRSNRTNYYTINYDKLDFVLKTPKAKWVSGARYKQRKLF
jgi:transcription initiation factor IIE alpha subunit